MSRGRALTAGRWSTRTALAVGVLASLVLGAGVLALLSDTVIVEDNQVTTGTRNSTMDLAIGPDGGSCNDLGDGPVVGRIDSVDLEADPNAGVLLTDYDFCVENRSAAPGLLAVSVANLVSLESGPCVPDEERFGDTTCGDGDAGELVLQPVVSMNEGSNNAGCGIEQFPGEPPRGGLGPGARCLALVQIQWTVEMSEIELVLAQTDLLQFDLEFTLTDPDNELPDPEAAT